MGALMKVFFKLYLMIFFIIFSYVPWTQALENKKIIGRIEKTNFPKQGFSLDARVDTGAHTTSLHMTSPKFSKQNGQLYIEFDTEDQQGKKYHLKTKVHKEVKIKGDDTKRYIIRESLCLSSVCKEININLTNRGDYKYKLLLGRNFLRGNFLVDVSLSHALGEWTFYEL